MAAIAIPLALQNLINVGVSLLDTVMLGQLGEVAMSGSSLGNQIGFIYQIMNLGLTAGAGVLTSQYWGRKDSASIRKVMSMAYKNFYDTGGDLYSSGFNDPRHPDELLHERAGGNCGRRRIFADHCVHLSGQRFYDDIYEHPADSRDRQNYAVYVHYLLFCQCIFNYCFIFGNFGFPRMELPVRRLPR